MSLRIRRGTDAQRQTLTFDQGEVVYTTDTKKLYVGDGITAGGQNILATSGGAGVTFNPTTQQFDFNTVALGLTTSDVTEGTRKYFTTQRAQDAAASLFTATGSPSSSGTISGTIATGTVVLASADASLVQGSRMVIAGAGGNGISAGTYYVVSAVGTSVVLANSLANATNAVPITGISTGSVTGTTYTAGGTDSGITFSYDSVNHVMNVVSSGTTSLINDNNPRLSANLNILNYSITSSGTGVINITGNITSGGTVAGSTLSATNANVTNVNTANINVPDASVGLQIFSKSGNSFSANYYNGTSASPTAIATGPSGMAISIKGYIGSNIYQFAGAVIAQWDAGATLTDSAPKSSVYIASGAGGSTNNFAGLTSAGVWQAAALQAGGPTGTGYNGSGNYPTPAVGMIIFDSSNNHFYGYNGTLWKQLDN
jgi:Major tropism determinant N-terminal domain